MNALKRTAMISVNIIDRTFKPAFGVLKLSVRFQSASSAASSPPQLKQKTVNSRMTLRYNYSIITANEVAAEVYPRPPLAVLLAWMLARDTHLEKYRQLYFRRGFDVLTVRTSPLDLLLPPIGGMSVARRLISFLNEQSYNSVLIHGFSVGAYQFGLVLHELERNPSPAVVQSLKGLILDSVVHPQQAPPGLSRAVTKHPLIQPILESSIRNYLKLSYGIAGKYYTEASNQIHRLHVKCPGLLLVSRDDIVSDIDSNFRLAKDWESLGVPHARIKCWDRSEHVLHLKDHPEEYENEIDSFISKLKL